MKTSKVQFEAKVEFLPAGEAGIPTAKLVGILGSYLQAGSPLLCGDEVYYKYLK